MLSNGTFEFTFRCHCGWFEEEHDLDEIGDEFSKRNSGNKIFKTKWSQENIKAVPTNAYGVVEFHGAGKRTRAKVQCIWVAYGILYRHKYL